MRRACCNRPKLYGACKFGEIIIDQIDGVLTLLFCCKEHAESDGYIIRPCKNSDTGKVIDD